jgi:hypothetical protein
LANVLFKLGDQVSDCYRRAAEMHENAEAAINPQSKRDYLDLKRRWLFLGLSYEFSEQSTDQRGPGQRAARERRAPMIEVIE